MELWSVGVVERCGCRCVCICGVVELCTYVGYGVMYVCRCGGAELCICGCAVLWNFAAVVLCSC